MPSATNSLATRVLAELRNARGTWSGHTNPPVATDVAPVNPLIIKPVATVATVATPKRQLGLAASQSVRVDDPDADQRRREGSRARVHVNDVASVVSVATASQNQWLSSDHMESGCGKCGHSLSHDGELLALWREGVASARQRGLPDWDGSVWFALLEGADRLLDRWGEHLAALGWTTADIFFLHRSKPLLRHEHAGLVRYLGTREVVALTAASARLQPHSKAIQTYYRRSDPPGQDWVAMWELATPQSVEQIG